MKMLIPLSPLRNVLYTISSMILLHGHLHAESPATSHIYTLLYTGKVDSAIVALNTLKQDDPQNIEINTMLGDAYLKQQHWHDAIRSCDLIYQLEPHRKSNIINYSTALQKVGYSTRAEQLLEEAFALDSTDMSLMRMLANFYYEEMNYARSSQYFQKLLSVDKTNTNTHLMAARCASKLKQSDRATQHYSFAHTYDPKSNKIVYEYARHLHSINRDIEALELIEQHDLDVSNNQKFILLLGACHYSSGDYTQAATYLEQAIAYQPKSVDLNKKLGFCYYVNKEYEKAYQRFLIIEPQEDDPATYYYLGLCAREIGLNKAAIAYLSKSQSLTEPKYLAQLYLVLGQCYHHLKEYPQAIKSFKEALKLTPDDGVVYYSLANTYNDFYADKSIALAHYKKALEQDLSLEVESYIEQQVQYLQKEIFFSK